MTEIVVHMAVTIIGLLIGAFLATVAFHFVKRNEDRKQ